MKLLSMNNYDMEANSRPEFLVSFKKAYGESMQNMRKILDKFRPDLSAEEKEKFIYVFFPFIYGIYPYTAVTEKQKYAMKEAGVNFTYQSIYQLTYAFLIKLLGN